MTTQLFTNANAALQTREIYPAERIPAAQLLTPAAVPSVEGFEGFGVAITAASCRQLAQMEQDARRSLLQDVYSDGGLGLSVGRVSIGSSDYSAELYSYDDTPFDKDLKHFSVARDEAYVIPMLCEVLQFRPDIRLLASPWSPPGWMKTGGLLCGGHMRREYVSCYADYTVRFLEAYAAHGIPIAAVTPQNEPETHQSGRMPACIWHPELEAEYIKTLRKKLDEKGLNVGIWAWDYNFYGAPRVVWSLENIPGLKESCDGVAFHYYKGEIEKTAVIREKFPALKLHFTEAGPRLYDHYDSDWCKWGIMISKALRCGFSSFNGWNLLLDELGGPNIGPFFCGGLVTRHSITGELSYSGQYKALRHIAPYIKKDSKIYPLTSDLPARNSMSRFPQRAEPVEGFMAVRGEKPVFVLVNPDKDKAQTQFAANGRLWYAELPPDSISTIVFA